MSVSVAAALGAQAGLSTGEPSQNPAEIVFFPVTGYFDAVANPSVSGVVNAPIIQPISALVTFTPRLARGQLLFMSNYLVTAAYNALQTVFLVGDPTGGTWTLSYVGATTTALAWDIAPADLQTALQLLPSIGAGNVTVTSGVSPLSYNVEFTAGLGLQFIAPLVGNGNLLTNVVGAGTCEVTTTATLLGSPQVVANTAVAISTLTARIWNGVLSTIDFVDTPGFQLPANYGAFDLDSDLIYDVAFTNVTFNGANQFLAPFAFKAPTDTTAVCITDPALERIAYQAPSTTAWTPTVDTDPDLPMSLTLINGGRRSWRERAADAR